MHNKYVIRHFSVKYRGDILTVLLEFGSPKLTLFKPGFFLVVCPGGGGGGGGGAEPTTLKFFPINNQNQTLHDVRYTFKEIIC